MGALALPIMPAVPGAFVSSLVDRGGWDSCSSGCVLEILP